MKMYSRMRAWGALSVVVWALAGCGGGGTKCVEGESAACACPDGRMGAQVCSGGEFGACLCEGFDGGLDAAMFDASMLDAGTDGDMPDATDDAGAGDGAVGDGGSDASTDGSVDASLDSGLPSCTSEGATRCGAEGVESCTGGAWTPTTPCAGGCTAGACDDSPVTCTPGERRCFRNSVQVCNAEGTAMLFDSVCAEACDAGACVGSCTPADARCSGDVREVCAADGSGFGADATCALGCDHRLCAEDELVSAGVDLTLTGDHVYTGCVDISLGAVVSVPAGESVEIWARCLSLASSASITLGAGAHLRVHASETVDLSGDASGGDELFFEAGTRLDLSGSVSSASTTLRADTLAIASGASTTGSGSAVALYGQSFINMGSHSGAVSVMPPEPVESPTYPSAGVWNLGTDDLLVAWQRPFPSVAGYYISVGDELPGPGVGQYRTEEYVVVPSSDLRPGDNRVRVVSVNADSEVGTISTDLVVHLNVRSPRIDSSSHPDPSAWGGPNDVFLSWSDPASMPSEAIAGYWWSFDRMADTTPSAASSYDDRNMRLLADQADGQWYFHIVDLDLMGRPSALVSHYGVRVGPMPALGNVAGTVTASADGSPIENATVLLNGGSLRAVTDASGDYTFHGLVPAATDAYQVRVSARGMLTQARDVSVGDGTSAVEDFALEVDPDPPTEPVRFGWPLLLDTTEAGPMDAALDASGTLIWSRAQRTSGGDERVTFSGPGGEALHSEATNVEYYRYGARTDVGAHDGVFYAVDWYKCEDNGSLRFGHGWSCLRMRTWDRNGTVTDGWTPFAVDGHSGSPTAIFNGTSYGVFFVSYSRLYHRELNADLSFANGLPGRGNADLLASGYGDSRQFARTQGLWDGSRYAVAWAIKRSPSDSNGALFFRRWDRTLTPVGGVVDLGAAQTSQSIGMAFDGAAYHLLYSRPVTGGGNEVVLRAIAGAAPERVLATNTGYGRYTGDLAFDGRYLFATYVDDRDHALLDVLDPGDHSSVVQYDLGVAQMARVTISPTGGEGAVVYTTPEGTYMLPFSL